MTSKRTITVSIPTPDLTNIFRDKDKDRAYDLAVKAKNGTKSVGRKTKGLATKVKASVKAKKDNLKTSMATKAVERVATHQVKTMQKALEDMTPAQKAAVGRIAADLSGDPNTLNPEAFLAQFQS